MPVSIADLPQAYFAKPDLMCPEYMLNMHMKNIVKYYQSEKVLGQLFRAIPPERVEFFRSIDRKITRRLRTVLQTRIMPDFPDPLWRDKFERLEAFSQEFSKICQQNSLNKAKSNYGSSRLSEMEGIVGVILSSSSDRRIKRETVVRLQDQTAELFDTLKHEIIGQVEDIYNDDDDDRTVDGLSLDELSLSHVPNQTLVARALVGWFVAIEAEQSLFGIHSFVLVCLQILCSELRV